MTGLMNGTQSADGDSPRLLLTSREAAAALSISERTLWQLREDGKIPCVLFGRNVRYNLSSLEEWIRSKEETRSPLRGVKEGSNGQHQ
jgi:excisionase family DNA binding protein